MTGMWVAACALLEERRVARPCTRPTCIVFLCVCVCVSPCSLARFATGPPSPSSARFMASLNPVRWRRLGGGVLLAPPCSSWVPLLNNKERHPKTQQTNKYRIQLAKKGEVGGWVETIGGLRERAFKPASSRDREMRDTDTEAKTSWSLSYK